MPLDPKNLKDIDIDALRELHRLSRKPGPSADLIAYADLWAFGLLTGGHSHAEITEAGREYLKKHW
ncbi:MULTISPECIES: hypothetical protein [unclassified Rhizobium]|uniref:hypothetical protein n=1 Tax=unclassified Rhizobium TaxID=2613769 RepID=UPI001ADD4035|nr:MULTISPECIES: hypothetical protein [unclassified Rhizobium]MBO9097646.1 hypothetical protein [Rhizobium sp. L58/93]MBO9183841.1 hypothetical protein [Rhizobium sp. E27B/91]QXZ85943.1 hypothetical protein J5287_00480 [Rhizobium sp. K1/93]QXZ91984.1 hypothetical protein J5280_09520 [Rhizobium sp. K15/93]QYA03509.1 hypothetical protein J5278_14775 [Rhizobium sp. B21/90]